MAISLVILFVTAGIQALVVAASGSVALLGDTPHDAADATRRSNRVGPFARCRVLLDYARCRVLLDYEGAAGSIPGRVARPEGRAAGRWSPSLRQAD